MPQGGGVIAMSPQDETEWGRENGFWGKPMQANENDEELAALRALPEDRQRAIVESIEGKSDPETLVDALRAEGVRATRQGLLHFAAWRRWQRKFEEWDADLDVLTEYLRVRYPGEPEEAIDTLGRTVFQMRAVREEKTEDFRRLSQARQKAAEDERKRELRRDTLRLQRERFEFDAARACLKKLPALKAIAADRTLDERGKIEAVRRKLFGPLPSSTRKDEDQNERKRGE